MTRLPLTELCIFALFMTAGCTANPYTLAVTDEARQINNTVLQSAELILCDGISVGAWNRAYGADPVRAAGWRSMCALAPRNTPRQDTRIGP